MPVFMKSPLSLDNLSCSTIPNLRKRSCHLRGAAHLLSRVTAVTISSHMRLDKFAAPQFHERSIYYPEQWIIALLLFAIAPEGTNY